jgi:hypothetical protein
MSTVAALLTSKLFFTGGGTFQERPRYFGASVSVTERRPDLVGVGQETIG